MVTPQIDLTMDTQSNTTSTLSTTEVHNLKNKWKLWAHLPHDNDWTSKSYKPIYKFCSAEDTIAITESLPEALVKNCMLFIMRDGVMPMWEDPKNRNGGCFSYKVSNKNVYDVWKELTYVLVGESISGNPSFVNAVTGITISPKKNFCIIKIWMNNCENQNPSVVTTDVNGLIPQGCLFKKHTPEF
jgi:hypothetical protein